MLEPSRAESLAGCLTEAAAAGRQAERERERKREKQSHAVHSATRTVRPHCCRRRRCWRAVDAVVAAASADWRRERQLGSQPARHTSPESAGSGALVSSARSGCIRADSAQLPSPPTKLARADSPCSAARLDSTRLFHIALHCSALYCNSASRYSTLHCSRSIAIFVQKSLSSQQCVLPQWLSQQQHQQQQQRRRRRRQQ